MKRDLFLKIRICTVTRASKLGDEVGTFLSSFGNERSSFPLIGCITAPSRVTYLPAQLKAPCDSEICYELLIYCCRQKFCEGNHILKRLVFIDYGELFSEGGITYYCLINGRFLRVLQDKPCFEIPCFSQGGCNVASLGLLMATGLNIVLSFILKVELFPYLWLFLKKYFKWY